MGIKLLILTSNPEPYFRKNNMHKKETIVLHTKAHFLKIFLFEAKIMYFLDFNGDRGQQ